MMTQALELRDTDRVLEVGTGSGYQAAVLSLLVPNGHLVTVERVPALADRARALLKELGYANVTVELAGPTLGCPGRAPFDAIVVTAAAPRLPPSLVDQLALGGRLVAPVGSREQQELVQARRTGEGVSLRLLGPCRFVPLLGPEAFPEG
jgi:protein-L-isoaspartate(D-aspartate) O-methyltransferase